MVTSIDADCNQHSELTKCPDRLIKYITKFNEYGIIIHDGGSSAITIRYCPWCGRELPESQRDEWFDQLEKLGFDDPTDENIPEIYKDSRWRSQ